MYGDLVEKDVWFPVQGHTTSHGLEAGMIEPDGIYVAPGAVSPALKSVHYLRLQEARRLLGQSELSCTDIAYETGFGDQSYSIKQYRQWMGVTPAKYRTSARG